MRSSMNVSEKTSQIDPSEEKNGFNSLLKPKQLRTGKVLNHIQGNAAGYSISKVKRAQRERTKSIKDEIKLMMDREDLEFVETLKAVRGRELDSYVESKMQQAKTMD